jgi:hypothetical protein
MWHLWLPFKYRLNYMHYSLMGKMRLPFTLFCYIELFKAGLIVYAIFIELCMKGGTLLPTLKGNNSCKTYNFRIKVRNVQMIYCSKLIHFYITITSRFSCLLTYVMYGTSSHTTYINHLMVQPTQASLAL